MNCRHLKYPEKFNNVKEGTKSRPEIAYGRTHNYGSVAFELSRFHCMLYPQQRSGGGYTGIVMAVRLSVRWSVCPWTQFCLELFFSYSFARNALKFIHNVCVHMKLCMCNFHDLLSMVVELSSLELVNFTELLLSREIILQYCMY